jgi:type IV secretion system protein TrbL
MGLMTQGLSLTWPMMLYAVVFAALPNFFSGLFFSFGFSNLQVPLIFIEMFGMTMTIGAFVFLGGTLLITIIEAYIVSVFGLLMAGFSPLRTTHTMGAQKSIAYAISVGVKLMTLYLVVGLIQTVFGSLISSAASVPISGAVTVGFYAMMLAIIAYNVPAFASSVVSGMLSSNGGAAATAMNAAAGTAMAMAQSMHNISEGMAEKKEAKKEARDAENQEKASSNMQGGSVAQKGAEAPNAAVPTPLAHDGSGSQQSQFISKNTPSAQAPQVSSSGQSSPGAAVGPGGSASMASNSLSDANGATSAVGNGLPQSGSSPGALNGASTDSHGKPKTAFEQMRADHDGGYGDASKNKTPEERDELRKAFHQDQQKALDDADKKIRDGVDGLGKSLEQMLLPAGSQSSGAVSGAQLKSSI